METRLLIRRDTRDQILLALGLGFSYPLRDLPLAYRKMIAVDQKAEITIGAAQAGVRYQLCDEDGNPINTGKGAPFTATGQPGEAAAVLATPPIAADVTFTILATRLAGDPALSLETYLNESVSFKAGVDPSVPAAFVPYEDKGQSADGLLIAINYGEKVRIRVGEDAADGLEKRGSQEGVSYQLVAEGEPQAPRSNVRRGNKGEILLYTSDELREDLVLMIKAYRTSNPKVFAFLDARLTVHVRPDPAVALALETPILDHNGRATLSLPTPQASATYALYRRQTAPEDYAAEAAEDRLEIDAGQGRRVYIQRPETITDWDDPAGFVRVGAFEGTPGEALTITTEALPEDALFVVRATKKDNPETLPLDALAAALVRPDPTRAVAAETSPVDADSVGMVIVTDAQPHVGYQLRREADDTPVNPPGYAKTDRGIGRARVEVDFRLGAPGAPDVYLPTDPLTETTAFNVLATKVYTGLQAPLTGTATIGVEAGIDTALAVAFVPYDGQAPDGQALTIGYGEKIRVRISESQEGISYRLVEDAAPDVARSNAWKGTGADLTFYSTEGFAEDVVLNIQAFRTSNPSLSAYLNARLTIHVRPNPAVALALDVHVFDYDAKTQLSLADPQASVTYQLYQRAIAPGDYATEDTEGRLEIDAGGGQRVYVEPPEAITDWDDPGGFALAGTFTKTGKLTLRERREDVYFVVRATKKDNGEALALDQITAVLVRPDATLAVAAEASPVEAGSIGVVTVEATQAGVAYQLRHDSNNVKVGAPGYDAADRWLERTRLEVDFAVEGPGDALLRLPTNPLKKSATFHVLATKLASGITAQLAEKATIEVPTDAPE